MRLPRRLPAPAAALALLGAAPATHAAPARCAGADALPGTTAPAQVRSATLCLLNVERTRRGRRPLRASSHLRIAAQRFAAQMVLQGFFDHISPGGSTLLSRVKAVRYLTPATPSYSAGENIGYGTGALGSPRRMVDAWMHSPGHRRNILDPAFRDIGIGVAAGIPTPGAKDGDGATFVTDFGRRGR